MLIKTREKLNSYINTTSNQLFYAALPVSGDVSLNIHHVGTAFPCSEYRNVINLMSPAGKFHKFEYVLEGKGYLEYNDETYELTEGSLIFIRSNTSFTMYSDKKEPMKKHFLGVSGKFVEGILSSHKISSPIIVIHFDSLAEFDNIIHHFERAEQMSNSLLNLVELELLKIVQKLDIEMKNRDLEHFTRAENILSYIEQNLTSRLTIEDITAAFFISKSQLIRIFKDKYNITPMKYVLLRKIDSAKYYLKNTELSITEISTLLCFSESKYFSKVFKKQVGMTPAEYRKKEFFEIAESKKSRKKAEHREN